MGDQKVNSIQKKENRSIFIRQLLNDIQALEQMLDEKIIESDITRIGSEQEFCILTENWRPSKMSTEILKEINDPHFTTEIALFNLEINLDPVVLEKDAFSKVENQLNSLLNKAEIAAEKFNKKILLTGILPTISKNELEIEYMTPMPRYYILNDMLKKMRGKDFKIQLRGVDELIIKHESVLFEACNTSFQMHLQIAPDDFISSYNWSQAISGPLLSICANSPLLLGRELWSETRVALFQQSIDTRSSSYALKNKLSRVAFGNDWAQGSVAEIYKDQIARHEVLIAKKNIPNSLEDLKNGNVPKLDALCHFNGTVYTWNRACYGISKGKAHLRIENRYIPSGPTTIDEMANFAFWVGLMKGRPKEYDDIANMMDFKDAKSNFFKAARSGKESVLNWNGKLMSARHLVIHELIPIARKGLEVANIDKKDIDRYLTIIERRAINITGAQWSIRNFRHLRKNLKQDEALLALTKEIYNNQQKGIAVHDWPMIEKDPKAHQDAHLVGHIMSTQLFTVKENDLADLALSIMKWKNIHHVPVRDKKSKLCGLLTWTHIDKYIADRNYNENYTVADIMTKKVLIVHPETKITEAINLMEKNNFGCLPVLHHNSIVGIITIKDIIG